MPPITLGRAPSMPATTMMVSADASRSLAASMRCRPATPMSFTATTLWPRKASVPAASAATGRSEVPAQATTAKGRSGATGSGPATSRRPAAS